MYNALNEYEMMSHKMKDLTWECHIFYLLIRLPIVEINYDII